MFLRGLFVKYAGNLLIALAAVLFGITNIALISFLSGKGESLKNVQAGESIRLIPFNRHERNFFFPREEPPPLPQPAAQKQYSMQKIPEFKPDIRPQVTKDLSVSAINIKLLCPKISVPKLASIDIPAGGYHLRQGKHPSFSGTGARHCFDMSEVDVLPVAISAAQPVFPFRARRLSIGGRVTVQFLVDTEGTVSKLTILDSNPDGIFEQSVMNTVPKWKYRPGKKDGRPVRTWVNKTIEFKLDDNM